MIPKRRNLISLIFIVNCISKCSLIKKCINCKLRRKEFIQAGEMKESPFKKSCWCVEILNAWLLVVH